jgi:hypothetical protein
MSASQSPESYAEERPNAGDRRRRSGFAYRELGTNNPGPPVVFLIHGAFRSALVCSGKTPAPVKSLRIRLATEQE